MSVLLPPVVAVLEKYGWKVPKMDYADYSRQLKMIGVMAGIKTRMHSHLARHTFATNMLSNDVKIQNVSKMLGTRTSSRPCVTQKCWPKMCAKIST